MLLAGSFDDAREVDQLATLFVVHEVGKALRPGILEFNQYLYQFHVVLELRVYYLDVLLVLFKEVTEV